MANLYISEDYINRTEGYRFGESDVFETAYDKPGDVYRYAQKEYGRCVSKVYVDVLDEAKAIGWVFVGRAQYEDTGDTYLREVWVTLHTAPPTLTREHHFAELDN